jgi:hypothetical protein
MFQSIRKKQLVVTASLLVGVLGAYPAHAGPMPPPPPLSEIDGEYDTNTLGKTTQEIVLNFTLSGGKVGGPDALLGFTAPNLGVQLSNSGVLTVTSAFNLLSPTNPSTVYIDYTLSSPKIANANEITATVRLAPSPPPPNTSGVNLVNLNPALLTLTFPAGTNLDPNFPPGPILFSITPIPAPEPASISHLAWVGALGVVGYWRRNRRSARTTTV